MTTRLMTAAALATCLFAAGSALAADTAPQNLKTVQALFDFADQNHDGRLTREEARGHLQKENYLCLSVTQLLPGKEA